MPREKITNPKNSDGLVWIKNGKVFVKNEERDGLPPFINPCKGVALYINGVECNHLSAVNEKDTIELKPLFTVSNLQLDVEISKDKLKCYLIFTPACQVRHKIVDMEPANKLDIQTKQDELERIKTEKHQIIEFLKSKNILHGIKYDVVDEICEKNLPGRFLVAEGTPKQDAIDDSIEYFFEVNDDEYNLREDETGNIDFKNILEYKTVTAGQVIARVHKGNPGKNGISVTGESIIPVKLKEIVITPSFSIDYNKETGNVRANKTGRPFVQEKGNIVSFEIYDSVIVDEVSIKTGNIRFKGDIEVSNNVYESMEVVAGQNVIVGGNVEFASIFAGNNIIISGITISSTLNAAMNDAAIMDPAPLLKKLIDGINSLITNIKKSPHRETVQFSELLRLLLNTHNRDLPNIVYEVSISLRAGNYDIDSRFILSLIKRALPIMGNYSEISDIQYLYQLINDLKMLLSKKRHRHEKGNVTLTSISNCDITALGDIKVVGKGSVNSSLYCKGKVNVAGYVRGGQIKAEKGIDINIAGSERGSKILLSVPEDSFIRIHRAYTDTTIKVGSIAHTFFSEVRMVHARLEEGKLVY